MNGSIASKPVSKKVLLVASYGPSLVNFRGPLIRDLQKAGHTVLVAAPEINDALEKELKKLGAEVHHLSMERSGLNPFGDLRFLQTLVSLMKKTDPDYVLTYTAKPNIWGALAAAISRKPSSMMVTGLGLPFTNIEGFKRRTIRFVTTKLYRLATTFSHRVIFQNPDDLNELLEAGALKNKEKAALVNGSGVDIDHYALESLPNEAVFFMAARLLGNKGVREYAEAAMQLISEGTNARFVLAGFMDGSHDSIQQNELDYWVTNGMEFVGPLDDIRTGLVPASIYVLPSYREGTPRSVLEAMSMGRPIITCDTPGCRETVEDGINGFLIPPRDIGALKAKMKWMIENPKARLEMGRASRKMVEEKYDVVKVNAMLMQHLGLLGSPSANIEETLGASG